MKNLSTKTKILIGAGIVLALFIIVLFILAGSSSGNGVPEPEVLERKITGITCETQSQGSFDYDLSIITNETDFDNNIQHRQYTKIVINHSADLESLGVGFAIKSDLNTTMTVTLMKNDEVLKADTFELQEGQVDTANLTLENPTTIAAGDNFYITITMSENATFAVDTFLFFMNEV